MEKKNCSKLLRFTNQLRMYVCMSYNHIAVVGCTGVAECCTTDAATRIVGITNENLCTHLLENKLLQIFSVWCVVEEDKKKEQTKNLKKSI